MIIPPSVAMTDNPFIIFITGCDLFYEFSVYLFYYVGHWVESKKVDLMKGYETRNYRLFSRTKILSEYRPCRNFTFHNNSKKNTSVVHLQFIFFKRQKLYKLMVLNFAVCSTHQYYFYFCRKVLKNCLDQGSNLEPLVYMTSALTNGGIEAFYTYMRRTTSTHLKQPLPRR